MNQKIRVGDVRPSAMLTTFGVGAIVDLPAISVLVTGLDDWKPSAEHSREITEERLRQAVRQRLGEQVKQLLMPPQPKERAAWAAFSAEATVGAPVVTFPRWMLCPQCRLLAPLGSELFESKPNRYRVDKTCYVHRSCPKTSKPPMVVPARFLVACENGHLDDFPWVEFTHFGPTKCHSHLTLVEHGASDEARDLEVRCETCGNKRRLADAFGEGGKRNLPACRSRRPHLRDYEERDCDRPLKAILLGASNLWFPDVLTTLAIPSTKVGLDRLVEEAWTVLQYVTGEGELQLLKKIGQLPTLSSFPTEEIWAAVERKRTMPLDGEAPLPEDLKQPEWEIFCNADAAPATDDFRLRQVAVPEPFTDLIESVVLAEKVRVVGALIGFTRIDAPGELGEQGTENANRRMVLSRGNPTWVPASEARGEGIFIRFRESAITDWLKRPAVKAQDKEFRESHILWRKARGIDEPEEEYPGMRYVLLHTVAHAIMRELVLECGYSAASIRERLYVRAPNEHPDFPDPMAGILLYTAASDSEGTLGGLVHLGETDSLTHYLTAALRAATLCGSDPLCAEHTPSQRGITLHAAACHACLFAPETSCERGNKYLDRSTLVPTVHHHLLAFFDKVDLQ